ncbi:unnamed protein product [Moneuplotes crassus]|uniref:EF-hand domain-containing protein n=1 Tax=Euplotes crassus TaxID=5936 RepID=A0AAD2D6E1_EUPCR|nr:unnamed protein product [Moneuplotes crassus]
MESFKTTASKLKQLDITRKSQNRNGESLVNKTKSYTKNNTSKDNINNTTSLEMIKNVCENYGLTRREVFEIHSQFKAMTIPLDHICNEGNTINEEYFEALKRYRNPEKYKKDLNKTQNDTTANQSSAPENSQEKVDGIRLDYFSDNCTFLYGTHPEVKTRLFKALGIDTESKNSYIKWEQFVELYCICELGNITKSELIRFWSKFFDPTMLGLVSVESIADILEKCVRGTSLEEPNEGTILFAKTIINLFREHGCIQMINNEEFVNNTKVSEAFASDAIDMKLFSDALGNKVVNFKID